MKKIFFLSLLSIVVLSNNNIRAQSNSSENAVAAVAGLFAIGSGIAAVQAMKERAELLATEWYLTNNTESNQFSVKTLEFDAKKMSDLSNSSLLVFRVVDFNVNGLEKKLSDKLGSGLKNLSIKNRYILLCFTSSGWLNEYGINEKKIKWMLINKEKWIDIMVGFLKTASGSDEDEIIRGLLRGGKIKSDGIENKLKGDLDFYKMGGDMYLVNDYSEEMKLIFNEGSLGIYLKETNDLIQISRRSLMKIHNFIMDRITNL